MHLDRLITLGIVFPFRHILSLVSAGRSQSSRTERVLPILMYHSISDDRESGVDPYYKVCTSPLRFAEHMQWLAEFGIRGVTLREGLAWLQGNAASGMGQAVTLHTPDTSAAPVSANRSPNFSSCALPIPCRTDESFVAITFDDGLRDFYTDAFSSLQQHGFSATMYLPTAFIGNDRRSFKSRECLTWSEVRELSSMGVEFGSHTVNHFKLTDLPWSEIRLQLRDSKAAIEQQIALPITSFAYPYAYPQANRAFSDRFQASLKETGYVNAVTTIVGRAQSSSRLLQLPRLSANSADDWALMRAKLRGAYDWMGRAQLARQDVRRLIRPHYGAVSRISGSLRPKQ